MECSICHDEAEKICDCCTAHLCDDCAVGKFCPQCACAVALRHAHLRMTLAVEAMNLPFRLTCILHFEIEAQRFGPPVTSEHYRCSMVNNDAMVCITERGKTQGEAVDKALAALANYQKMPTVTPDVAEAYKTMAMLAGLPYGLPYGTQKLLAETNVN